MSSDDVKAYARVSADRSFIISADWMKRSKINQSREMQYFDEIIQ